MIYKRILHTLHKLFNYWRYYSFGREQYYDSFNNLFSQNLISLRQVSNVLALFTVGFSFFSLFVEKDYIRFGVLLLISLVAFILSYYINYIMQTTAASHRIVYKITVIYYFVLLALGLFLCVFSAPIAEVPHRSATAFLCILICALLLFFNSPLVNFIFTISGMAIFIISSILVKPSEIFKYDIVNVILAGSLTLFFSWHIAKLRLGLELSTSMLEEERQKYLNESTIDELTQLNNRRDFMQTFQRYIRNYRTSDDWLCICISDIDFFKFYNDNYGHPQGDECLRSIGTAFSKLHEELGVYVARVGGEEFAMLWFEKDSSNVDNVISTITQYIKDLEIIHEYSNVSKYVTMSIGVYIERLGSPSDIQTLYDLADKALYAAKGSGRNCAVINGSEIEQYNLKPNES
jgi:diguanylate cyclase (GGDEF)-like protein